MTAAAAIDLAQGDGGPDLGFTFRLRKSGEVEILHRGRLALTLRGAAATEFRLATQTDSADAAQRRMARLTGNYKRGNEGQASRHPRNLR